MKHKTEELLDLVLELIAKPELLEVILINKVIVAQESTFSVKEKVKEENFNIIFLVPTGSLVIGKMKIILCLIESHKEKIVAVTGSKKVLFEVQYINSNALSGELILK